VSRIASCLAQLSKENKKALVPYFVVGDPTLDMCVPMMHGLVDAGADILELGVPFSDPMAEGPVIQLAHERALLNNTSLNDVLQCVRVFRQKDQKTPVVLMGYANPIEVMGYESFAKQAAEAGVDGVLTVDMPPEEAKDFVTALKRVEIDNIYLIAPTTTIERVRLIAKHASGYLYYVSLKGVTGAGHLDIASVKEKVEQIQSITSLPLCIGFGIKDAVSAQKIAQIAQGAVVGSALIDRMANAKNSGEAIQNTTTFLRSLRCAIDSKP
jgi:tryptophan synthase alpha chain